jgi:predicted DCC family thiol-disulfide oxidoreductase YuxK
MKSPGHVGTPPPKSVLLYDGDCDFCLFWVHRWRGVTADRIDYLPFQDPEIARDQLASAVRLIQPEGTVFSGAEAVFLALASHPDRQRLLNWYRRSPRFARLAEAIYRFASNHRRFFSTLTLG